MRSRLHVRLANSTSKDLRSARHIVGVHEVVIGSVVVGCRIRRHARARRITLRVREGRIHVTAPVRVPVSEIRRCIDEHLNWIEDALLRERACVAADLRVGDRIPFLDGSVTIVEGRSGTRYVSKDAVAVRANDPILPQIEQWYRRAARPYFQEYLERWAPRIGVTPSRLVVRGQRSRWGSASANATISLNWRLMMAPPRIGEYVVVHELVHLIHMDHSARFWDCVGGHWPTYSDERVWLRVHGPELFAGPVALGADSGEVS